MKLCKTDDYIVLGEGEEAVCESPYLGAYYFSGVIDVDSGTVRVRVDAGPQLRTAVEDEYEAPGAIVLTPILMSGPGRLAVRCVSPGGCRVWYRLLVVDITQIAFVAAILAGAAQT